MDVYNSKKLIRSKSGLKIVCTNEEFKSPFVIQEPSWVLDSEVLNCTNCSAKFNFTTRKHHCRRCGQIYCNFCCKTKMGLPRMCFVDPVRICSMCEPLTRLENTFFDKQLKLLLNGAIFKLENEDDTDSSKQLLQCKLSADHRYLLFDGVNIPPIEINLIQSLRVQELPATGLKSLLLEYQIGDCEKWLRLHPASGAQLEKTSCHWIAALDQAYKMMKENESLKNS